MMIKNQNFGIEIELTGITRQNAAKVIANYFGTTSRYLGSYYQVYGATDRKGRTWKAMSDGSIVCQVKRNGRIECAGPDYSCEIVSPILQYEDIEDLQNIVRELVKAGAMANTSCGIHVHVDGANHTPESLTRLLNFATGRQDLFYEALQIGARENRWCHKISPELLKAMKASMGGNEEFVSVSVASEILGISERTVRAMLREGKLRGYKLSEKCWKVYSQSIKEVCGDQR